ncbi:MAG: phosphatidylglycerophosphatase A [Planctomycetota bacterium]|jgi:undecaprenyl-diphosphatase
MKKAELLTTCFGLGKLPFAPGTWGSLPPVVAYQVLGYLWPAANPYFMAFFIIAGSWACVRYAPAVTAATGKKDPGMIVADEVAGQGITMLFIAAAAAFGSVNICNTAVLGFVLFRLFDILKPWPCKRLEKLPAGVGILADDLMAGVYGGIVAVVYILLKDHFQSIEQAAEAIQPGVFFAAILGTAQGLTEFLPVSSSGHLVLIEHFIPSLDPESETMLLFDLLLHVATVGSILIVFASQIRRFFKGLCSIGKHGTLNPIILYQNNPAIRFCVLAIIATFTTALCYKLFKDPLESARKLEVLACTWVVTAAVLLITDQRTKARRGLRDIGIAFAIILGIAQSVAILPGISRSGATICTAILLGLHRRWAIEFSFLISIPAILGGAVLQIIEHPGVLTGGGLSAGFIATGTLTALIAGVLSLKWLIRASRRRKLAPFALYCLLLAGFVLFYLL